MQALTKVGLMLVLALIAGIIWYRYDQYILVRSFMLHADTACDPSMNSCFVSDCSPEDDPGCETEPYEKVDILASDAPGCLAEHTCASFSCEGAASCSIAYCSDDTLEDGEACSTAATDAAAPDEEAAPENTAQ